MVRDLEKIVYLKIVEAMRLPENVDGSRRPVYFVTSRHLGGDRELTNRRLWLDDAFGFRDMPTAHACRGSLLPTSRQSRRR